MENTNLKSVDENHVAQTSYDTKNIQKLEGLEVVFMKPGMYIGSTDAKGKQHCFIEIVDNSVDEHNGGFCDNIDKACKPSSSLFCSKSRWYCLKASKVFSDDVNGFSLASALFLLASTPST